MVRSRRLTQALLDAWLRLQPPVAPVGPYRLRLWKDHAPAYTAISPELADYLNEIFEEVRRKLRRGFADPLSPFTVPTPDPAANYPALLHRVTLQGYFGETLAILAVEHWGAHGHTDWQAPALLFRLHEVEFQHLDAINEKLRSGLSHTADDPRELRPGRTGDDAIAFRLDSSNVITDVLVLEAKCLESHKLAKIREAHAKLSDGIQVPTSVRELVSLLSEYDTPDANRWQEALLALWQRRLAAPNRFSGVVYACGQEPVRRGAWMSDTTPDSAYSSPAHLEAMEFHIVDLPNTVQTIYR
jgi:hypothetical protein